MARNSSALMGGLSGVPQIRPRTAAAPCSSSRVRSSRTTTRDAAAAASYDAHGSVVIVSLLVRWPRGGQQVLDQRPEQHGPVGQPIDEHVLVVGVGTSSDGPEPVEGRHADTGGE